MLPSVLRTQSPLLNEVPGQTAQALGDGATDVEIEPLELTLAELDAEEVPVIEPDCVAEAVTVADAVADTDAELVAVLEPVPLPEFDGVLDGVIDGVTDSDIDALGVIEAETDGEFDKLNEGVTDGVWEGLDDGKMQFPSNPFTHCTPSESVPQMQDVDPVVLVTPLLHAVQVVEAAFEMEFTEQAVQKSHT